MSKSLDETNANRRQYSDAVLSYYEEVVVTKDISVALRGSDVLPVPGPRGQALVARDADILAACMGRVYPFAMDKGVGCEVWDVDGHRYLDMAAGIAVVSTGHSHPQVIGAMQSQLQRFVHMAGTDFVNEQMVSVAEKLAATMPGTDQWQVFLTNSGTEAIEAAIKLARHATGRQGIISFLGAFHGRSYGSMSLTASKSTQRRGHMPLVPSVFHAFYANPYRTPFGIPAEQVTQATLDYIEKTLFGTIAPPSDIAAIILEPIQGEGGYIVPAPGFLCGVRQICDRHGILLIYDEVQSGVGRTGKMWAHQHESSAVGSGACAHCSMSKVHGCTPDILVTAKGLGAGMPIGGIVARRELMDRWSAGAHGSTYAGNAIACAAANQVLNLVNGGLAANAATVGAHLKQGLIELQSRYACIGDVRGRGLMLGVDFVLDRATKEPAKALADTIMEEAFRRGMLILTCGYSTIRFCPPLVLSIAEADEALERFEATIKAVWK